MTHKNPFLRSLRLVPLLFLLLLAPVAGHAGKRWDGGEGRFDLVSGKKKPVIIINLPARLLRVYVDGKKVLTAPAAVGRYRYPGEVANTKTRVGDYRIESWYTSYANKHYPHRWKYRPWQGAFGKYTAVLGPDALYQHIHGPVGPEELGDWIIERAPPRDRRPREGERTWSKEIKQFEYGLSHGCVRVSNRNITRLRELCPVGSKVYKIYCLVEQFEPENPWDLTEKLYPNIYRYEDVDNGVFWPDLGVVENYHHPADNDNLGPAIVEDEEEEEAKEGQEEREDDGDGALATLDDF